MFEKLLSFTKKVADLADRPALNPADLKAHFDAAPDEARRYFNNLIDALKKTEAGDSGAKNIGATAISGLTGTDVQSLLESLNTVTVKKELPAWVDLTTTNGVQINESTLRVFKDDRNMVYLEGSLQVPDNFAGGSLAFTIPDGFRPVKKFSVNIRGWKNSLNGYADTEIVFDTDGTVKVGTGASKSFGQWVFLGKLWWRTDS